MASVSLGGWVRNFSFLRNSVFFVVVFQIYVLVVTVQLAFGFVDALWRDLRWVCCSSRTVLFDLSMGLLSFEADANLCCVRKFAASCCWRHWRCRVMPDPIVMPGLRCPFNGWSSRTWSNPGWSVFFYSSFASPSVSISFVFHRLHSSHTLLFFFALSSMRKLFRVVVVFPIINTFYITLELFHRFSL